MGLAERKVDIRGEDDETHGAVIIAEGKKILHGFHLFPGACLHPPGGKGLAGGSPPQVDDGLRKA